MIKKNVSKSHCMPNGRKPIQTAICASQNTIFQFIKKEIEKGHQAYVVCPLIEDKQGVMEGILSVEQTYTEYTNIFGKNAVAVLNGKMNEDETEKVIRSFKNGEIKILVSTTVVEVGVNVSNATVIVINNAERFGLASLHQLRGRVGRGNSQGYCILNSVHKNNKRLLALCKYKNGFQIAESDYALRGSGNILGTEQSGSNYYVELSMKYPDLFSELQKYAKKYMDTPAYKKEGAHQKQTQSLARNNISQMDKEDVKKMLDSDYFNLGITPKLNQEMDNVLDDIASRQEEIINSGHNIEFDYDEFSEMIEMLMSLEPGDVESDSKIADAISLCQQVAEKFSEL